MEIEKAIEATDVILVCLSNNSITKEGYAQKEIKTALDYSDYKPDGTVFIIPVRLEECKPPTRLSKWHYADYFEGQRERGIQRLQVSLRKRAESLNLHFEKPKLSGDEIIKFLEENLEPVPSVEKNNKLTLSNGMEFMRVPAGKFLMGSTKENKFAYADERPQHIFDIPYEYFMARFPVTNELYNDYAKERRIKHPVWGWEKIKDLPVDRVSWNDVMGYCQWINNLSKPKLPSGLMLRLPSEVEWEKSARSADGREYPWGKQFDKNKCNTAESGKGNVTPIDFYSPQGDSPYGCADMVGNVWEWTHSLFRSYPYKSNDGREGENIPDDRVLRGGSFYVKRQQARTACRLEYDINDFRKGIGFRICLAPPLPK